MKRKILSLAKDWVVSKEEAVELVTFLTIKFQLTPQDFVDKLNQLKKENNIIRQDEFGARI